MTAISPLLLEIAQHLRLGLLIKVSNIFPENATERAGGELTAGRLSSA